VLRKTKTISKECMKVHSTHGTSYLSPFVFFFLLFDLLLFPTSKLNHNSNLIKLNKKLRRPNANKSYFLHVVILVSNAYGGKCQMQIRAYAHTSVQHIHKTKQTIVYYTKRFNYHQRLVTYQFMICNKSISIKPKMK
jgi:hypothetical protein